MSLDSAAALAVVAHAKEPIAVSLAVARGRGSLPSAAYTGAQPRVLEAIDKLTAAVAAGDPLAVEVFYRRYFKWLYRQAASVTGRDEAFCLDVVQESVLRILRTIRAVESEAQLATWLRLVVRTTAYDMFRGERRRQNRERALPGRQPAERADEEMLLALRRQLDQVDRQIALMIDLRYTRGWTLSQIAERLGLTTGTVDGRLRRALRRLRGCLEEVHDESHT